MRTFAPSTILPNYPPINGSANSPTFLVLACCVSGSSSFSPDNPPNRPRKLLGKSAIERLEVSGKTVLSVHTG